jgi:hypothetical protein
MLIGSAVCTGDEAGDIVALGADIGEQAIVERMQLADGDPAQAPVGKFAGQGFEHLWSPRERQSSTSAETGGFGFSGLTVLALHGDAAVSVVDLYLAHFAALSL